MNKEHEAKKYTLKVCDHKLSVFDLSPEMIYKAYKAGWEGKEASVRQSMQEIESDLLQWDLIKID